MEEKIRAGLFLVLGACGGSPTFPDLQYIGGYVTTIDKAFEACRTVLQQSGYEVAHVDPKSGVIDAQSSWVYHRVPKPGASFRCQVRVFLEATGDGLTHISLAVYNQDNGNRDKPEDIASAQWGPVVSDRAKHAEVQHALQKAISGP